MASNRDVAEARFLLAYHYMIDGHNDAAAEQFKAAVRLNPQDHLSAQLLQRDGAEGRSTGAGPQRGRRCLPSRSMLLLWPACGRPRAETGQPSR